MSVYDIIIMVRKMKIKVGISNRHVHLTQEDLNILYGEGYILTKKVDVNQPGQFASVETVTLKTDKSEIENVRILGPVRNYTQAEISKTDAYKLGINPPVRDSGDIENSAIVTICGPKGEVTKECCILARRHIHVTPKEKEFYHLPNIVSIKVKGIRSGLMEEVYVKVADNSYFEMHIDTDEANAFLLNNDDEVEIIK